MNRILKLAWRNLGRNRRRTIITGAALVVGVALSVAGYGLMDGMNGELLRALTRNELGHVQVHNPAYPDSRAVKHALSDPGQITATAVGIDGVVQATPRVYGFALLSANGKSLGAELVGVDPVTERRVTTLHERRTDGRYLDDEPTPWPRGRALTDQESAQDDALSAAAVAEALAEIEGLDAPAVTDSSEQTLVLAETLSPPPKRPPRVYIGVILAKILNVKVGDTMHATGQTADGLSEEVFFEIAGTFRTGTASLDRGRVYLHIVDMQRFVHLYDRVHELSIATTTPQDASRVAAALAARLGPDHLVRSWSVIRPDIQKMLDMSDVGMAVMIFIIFFVAALGVVNTMLMAVFERTRELGMLKAIGMSGRSIVGLIVAETLFLVLLFSVIGTGAGLAIDWYMVVYGVDFSDMTGGFSVGGIGINPVFHGAITAKGVIMPTVVLAATCFLASFYPAVRAARLRPAVGMRET